MLTLIIGPVWLAIVLIATTVLVSWTFPADFESNVAKAGRYWTGVPYLVLFQLTGFVLLAFGVYRLSASALVYVAVRPLLLSIQRLYAYKDYGASTWPVPWGGL